MHFDDFKAAIDGSKVETYERVIFPGLDRREFGFVFSVGSIGGPILVTPPEVVRRRNVAAWRLVLDPAPPPAEKYDENPSQPGGRALVALPSRQYFAYVREAVPVRTKE